MYGLFSDGEPFRVYARRESLGASALVLKFECKEGMGILGLRKAGRTDPAPAPAYEEEDIDPASLRAGRFVHVLPSGQRQSYALSRISIEVAGRMPTDRWVELKPHTEYGFRYLVVPETELDGTTASVRVTPPTVSHRADEEHTLDMATVSATLTDARAMQDPPTVRSSQQETARMLQEPDTRIGATRPSETSRLPEASAARPAPEAAKLPPRPAPVTTVPPPAAPRETTGPVARETSGPIREAREGLPPPQAAIAPAIAEAALRLLTKEQAIEYLKAEMQKVHALQLRVAELEQANRRGRQREKDLIELLARWEAS